MEGLYTAEGEPVDSCPHARQILWVKLSAGADEGDLLRRKEPVR